jgi:hypothetical protein
LIDHIADLNVDRHAVANDTGAASHLDDISNQLTGTSTPGLCVLDVTSNRIDNCRVQQAVEEVSGGSGLDMILSID